MEEEAIKTNAGTASSSFLMKSDSCNIVGRLKYGIKYFFLIDKLAVARDVDYQLVVL